MNRSASARYWLHRSRLEDGSLVVIRGARAGDEAAIQAFIRSLSVQSRYQRFFLALSELSQPSLARITSGDDSHIALLALEPGGRAPVVVGMAECVAGSEGAAEVAVLVAEHRRKRGLATRLLMDLSVCAAAGGISRVEADILRDNVSAIRLAYKLGGKVAARPAGVHAIRIAKALDGAARTEKTGVPVREVTGAPSLHAVC